MQDRLIVGPLALSVLLAACGAGQGPAPQGTGASGGGTATTITSLMTAPSPECLSTSPCVDDSDCPMGEHCNQALMPPLCEKLYCGSLGSQCSQAANCSAGLDCVNGACCTVDGQACATDADCCTGGCAMGVCKRPCAKLGARCETSGGGAECCGTSVCESINGAPFMCYPCMTCWQLYGGDVGLAACSGAEANLMKLEDCTCNGACASTCGPTMCQGASDQTCDDCIASMCASELATCKAN